MDKTNYLGEERVLKLILDFSIPTIIGLLIGTFYNFIDRIFIGNSVGVPGIAGVTVTLPFVLIMVACSFLIGISATSMISINLGQQKVEEAEQILGNAVVLLVLLSLIITVVSLLFLDPLLKIFGASDAVLPYARNYAGIILLGTLFQLLSLGLNTLIRATGSPVKAMVAMIVGSVLNAILAPLFIFVFHWGMQGAASATVIALIVSAAVVVSHFLGKNSFLKIRVKNLKLQVPIVLTLLTIGAAPFTSQIVESIFNVIMNNNLAKYGGDIAVSNFGSVLSLYVLILMPIFGISQGIQAIIGFNYGAKKFGRVRETLTTATLIATLIAVFFFIITRLFPGQVIAVFNHDPHFIQSGTYMMGIVMLTLPILGFQSIGSSYFQAVGKSVQAIFLSLARQVLFLIPALLILPHLLQLFGVLISIPIADILATTVTGILLFFGLRQPHKQHEEAIIRKVDKTYNGPESVNTEGN